MTVTVIVPAYNAEPFIEKALHSILAQQLGGRELEILVVDDKSSDDTRGVVQRFGAQHGQVRLLVNERTKGPSGARNTGLLAARGEFVAFLDADDVWYPNHLQEALQFLDEHSNVDVAFYNFDIIEQPSHSNVGDWFSIKRFPMALKHRPLGGGYNLIEDDMLNALIEESFLHLQAMVIRRTALAGVMFNEAILRSGDRDFAISVAMQGRAAYAFRDLKTSAWYRHAASLTSNRQENFLSMALDHVAFFRAYLGTYADRPTTVRILKRVLRDNHLDVSYAYRQKHSFVASLKHLVASARYGVQFAHLRELFKLAAAPLVYGISVLGKR